MTPATANTVAKIVHGISDTLVTNAVAQAGKGAVKTLIVPVDIHPGPIDTVLPSKMEVSKCEDCKECVASLICEQKAIVPHKEIDLLKCIGCGLCEKTCPNHLITLFADKEKVAVTCSNHEKGAVARKKCTNACIKCKKCENTCPTKAITVKDNLAQIDYRLCINCGKCVEVCPTHCIIKADLTGMHHIEEQ